MKPKTLVLMVVAVTCGLGASYMTSRLLADRSDDSEKIAILVAKKQLDNGATIKVPQDWFEEKLFVKGEEPRDALAKFDDLKGRIMKRTLRPGDFIRTEDMLDSKDPQSFAVNLPEGYRAVGQRVNLESTASGFASLPHSRVDVIQTVRRGDDKSSYAQIILENVLVLAADQRTSRDESGSAMPAAVVTFALSPEDAMTLMLAREVGPLSLALRKTGDVRRVAVNKVTMADLRNGTQGFKDAENSDGASEANTGHSGPVVALPPLNAGDAKPAEMLKADAAPLGQQHNLTLIEGDRVRQVPYLLDKDGRVVNQDVVRSEVSPVRPPQADRPERPDRPEREAKE
jgi:pilus assembly protein CpaB